MSISLLAEGVTKRFAAGSATVLRGIDVALQPGHVTLVRGEPGAGKSTLLRCLAGTYRLDEGHIRLRRDGEERAVDAADARAVVWLRWHHLGLADGQLVCAPREPALAAVARPLERAGADPGTAREEAAAVLVGLGLGDLADVPVGLLSRRASRALAIARSLLRPPGVLLLDEPLLGLGDGARRHVIELLRSARAARTALLVSARDGDALDGLADRELRLHEGRLA